ncbi:hypothetical protein Glove_14g7 [Diversispora epigaea]|uniref:DUF5672 domain-containing protein n=1 Tax=Diversispora epigaea TaxID=1348612 RepID=A0A397JRB8_9GLOM|nr:hypothetical protein Glove_14g7 [Diversispora epigaea]
MKATPLIILIMTCWMLIYTNSDMLKYSANYQSMSSSPSSPPSSMGPQITIITGVSYNHFCPLHNLIYHMESISSDLVVKPRIIIYDIGLRKYQYNALTAYQSKGYFSELRKFNFTKYPSFWNLQLPSRGHYAWKPAIVYEVSKDYPGELLLWVDSETLISKEFLNEIPFWSDMFNGFVSPRSSGDVGLWTHPGVFQYFNDSRKKYLYENNCNGAALLFNTNKTQHLIDAWYKCALVKDCIAPRGSNRTNHRQDQSIITYLALRDNRKCNYEKSFFKIDTHKKRGCYEKVLEYEKINGNVWTPSQEDLKEISKLKYKKKVDIWTMDI